jgi:hypothetical protein
MRVARDAFGKLRHRGVLEVVDKFLVVLQLHKETGSVIVRRKDRASIANQQTTAVGNLTAQRDDVGSQFNGRLVAEVMAARGCRVGLAAVIPPECQRILLNLSVMVERMRMSDGMDVLRWEIESEFWSRRDKIPCSSGRKASLQSPSGSRGSRRGTAY